MTGSDLSSQLECPHKHEQLISTLPCALSHIGLCQSEQVCSQLLASMDCLSSLHFTRISCDFAAFRWLCTDLWITDWKVFGSIHVTVFPIAYEAFLTEHSVANFDASVQKCTASVFDAHHFHPACNPAEMLEKYYTHAHKMRQERKARKHRY